MEHHSHQLFMRQFGFDSGPANILLDSWCQQHKQQAYDHNGLWAKSGEVSKRLLSKLLDHPYFALPYPKSTGRETFNSQWLQGLLNNFDDDFDTNDVQATLLALTTQSIAQAVEQLDRANAAAVYICGGGAKNETLMHQLGTQLAPRKLDTTTALGIEPEWVECAAKIDDIFIFIVIILKKHLDFRAMQHNGEGISALNELPIII